MTLKKRVFLEARLSRALKAACSALALTVCLGAAAVQAADTGARHHAQGEYGTVTATYVVVKGDDLIAIGERFEIPVETLKALNKLTTDGIKVGDQLVLAATDTGEGRSAAGIPASITTPDKLETSLGALVFKDGAPSKETVAKIYDYLDLMHGVEAFVNAYQGASTTAAFKGFQEAGVPNNTALVFSELMDSKSLFLTANADTIYFWANLDATAGPLVVETPPMSLGIFDDMWFNWISDFGLPGPDRGEGGKFLLVPPDYKGELPESGYFINHMRTTRALMLGRSFLEDNDPKRPTEIIKKTLKIYPYLPGGYGTSIGSALQGDATLARTPAHKLDWYFLRPQPTAQFFEGTGKVMNTVPPSDFSYFEMITDLNFPASQKHSYSLI